MKTFYGGINILPNLADFGVFLPVPNSTPYTPSYRCWCLFKFTKQWLELIRATNNDGKIPADLVRELWGLASVEEEDAEFPIRPMLTRAPADKAWYRRGWLVMLRSRALLEKTRVTQRHRGERLDIEESTHLAVVVHKLIDEQEEGVFRKVVSFV